MAPDEHVRAYTVFADDQLLATGSAETVAKAASAARSQVGAQVLIFDDHTGRQVELDLRAPWPILSDATAPPERPGRGRPKLGVVAREVTLLPRHWEWLATQQGGASAALRRLVEDARRANAGPDEARRAQQALYSVMSTLAGDLAGFEEAARALYAGDDSRFDGLIEAWPQDIRNYVARLADIERKARAR
jgi:hypothetical protein